MPKLVRIGAREVDLDKALPITVRDWRALKALGVNVLTAFQQLDPDTVFVIGKYLVQKADPEVTEDELLDLQPNYLVRIFQLIGEGQDADLPF